MAPWSTRGGSVPIKKPHPLQLKDGTIINSEIKFSCLRGSSLVLLSAVGNHPLRGERRKIRRKLDYVSFARLIFWDTIFI